MYDAVGGMVDLAARLSVLETSLQATMSLMKILDENSLMNDLRPDSRQRFS